MMHNKKKKKEINIKRERKREGFGTISPG